MPVNKTSPDFAKDANNQWADQDAADARSLGLARRTGELIPTAEKFSSIATVLAGQGYPWSDVYQAYHRLLTFHEHTDGIHALGVSPEYARRYETLGRLLSLCRHVTPALCCFGDGG